MILIDCSLKVNRIFVATASNVFKSLKLEEHYASYSNV